MIILMALALSLVACSGGEPDLQDVPEPDVTQPDKQTSTKACEPAPFAPTYLPWQESGSIPAPEEFKNVKDIILVWLGPARGNSPSAQVDLSTTVEDKATGEGEVVPVRGAEGDLTYTAEFHEMALRWTERDKPCGHYGLFFTDRKLPEDQVKAEILKIAESLK